MLLFYAPAASASSDRPPKHEDGEGPPHCAYETSKGKDGDSPEINVLGRYQCQQLTNDEHEAREGEQI